MCGKGISILFEIPSILLEKHVRCGRHASDLVMSRWRIAAAFRHLDMMSNEKYHKYCTGQHHNFYLPVSTLNINSNIHKERRRHRTTAQEHCNSVTLDFFSCPLPFQPCFPSKTLTSLSSSAARLEYYSANKIFTICDFKIRHTYTSLHPSVTTFNFTMTTRLRTCSPLLRIPSSLGRRSPQETTISPN